MSRPGPWGPFVSAAILAVLIVGSVLPASAFTKLEGEYNFQVDIRKQDRRWAWNFDSNSDDTWNATQFRLFSQPVPQVEAFLRFEADWNTGNNRERRPQFQYREGHVKFRKDYGGKGFESYLFSRQDRFWVDNHLIQVVQGGRANDNGNAHGARVDLWGYGSTNLNFIVSDFTSQGAEGDDAYIGRLRREMFNGALRTGITWNRKNSTQASGGRVATEVWAADMRYRWKDIDFSLEYAEGQQRNSDETYRSGSLNLSKLKLRAPSDGLPDDAAVKAEIRSVRMGNHKTGYLNIAPSAWYWGPAYSNQLGDGNSDEAGYYINTWYLIPGRAITLSNNYLSYTKRLEPRHVTEFYSEAYVEFVNGFTGKFFFRKRTTRVWREDEEAIIKDVSDNDDVFAEMQVENRLAWLRVQFRIRDISTLFQKELASIETSVNLTETLKIYNRYTFANDPARSRKGLFSELQYRPRHNMEVFLAYGPFWIGGGSNPVYEGNLEGSGDNRDLVRLTVKGTF